MGVGWPTGWFYLPQLLFLGVFVSISLEEKTSADRGKNNAGKSRKSGSEDGRNRARKGANLSLFPRACAPAHDAARVGFSLHSPLVPLSYYPSGNTRSGRGSRALARGFFANSEGEIAGWDSNLGDPGGWFPWLISEGIVPEPPAANHPGIPTVVIPPPVQLSPDADPAENASILGACYRGVLTAANPEKPCYAFASGDIRNSKYFRILSDWARYVSGLPDGDRISPVLWLGWMLRRWAYSPASKRGMAMPVNYSFSLQTVSTASNRDWCRQDMGDGSDSSGRLLVSDELRTLRSRYSAMRVAVFRLGAWASVADVFETVDRFFPGRTYQTMVAEAANAQRELSALVLERAAMYDPTLWGCGRG